MERKLTKLEHSRVEVIVDVDEKTWKDAQNKAFKKLAADVTVPGFRKGKAPENMVKSKINQAKVYDEAINALLPVVYRDILDNEKIKPFTQPKVDVTKLSDKEIQIKFVIPVVPEIELGKYKGLSIGHGDTNVKDDEVDNAIDELRKTKATLTPKDGVSEMDDVIVFDFKGYVDDKEFQGGSAQNYELKLGSHSFIPGFEEQMVNHKVGDHFDINVKFPENYTPELKGKDAKFTCDIHEIKKEVLPELNDEFVKELKINNVNTVSDLKANKKAELIANKKRSEKAEYINKLLDAIRADSKAEIPDEVIDEQVEARKNDIVNRMAQSGLNLEQYLGIIGQKEDEFMAKLKEESVKDITNYIILNDIAKKEGLDVTDADVEFEIAKIADQYKMKIEDVKKTLESQMDQFRNNIKMTRVEDFLTKNND